MRLAHSPVAHREADAYREPMRLRTIRLRGLGPYSEEVELDLDTLSGNLVAIVGDIGAGKSVLLEAYAGACSPHRKTPTRGTLDALAEGHGRDAFVEVCFDATGKSYRIRHDVGRGSAHVYIDDVALKLDGKVSRVDEWMVANLLAPEVRNAAFFLGQRSEGLIAADGAERREALLLAIGIAEIEREAEKARAGSRAAEKALRELVAAIDREGLVANQFAERERRHGDAASALASAERRRDEAEGRLVTARAELAAYQTREQERAALEAEARRARDRHGEAARAVADLRTRLDALGALLASAPQIRADVARAGVIATDLQERREAIAAVIAASDRSGDAAAAEEKAVETARARWATADRRRRDATGRLADRAAIEAAVAALPARRAAEASEAADLAAREQHLQVVREGATRSTEGRIDGLRGALGTIEAARKLAEAKASARSAREADDLARSPTTAADLAAIEGEIDGLRARLNATRKVLLATERTAARANEIAVAESAIEEARREMETTEAAGRKAKEAGATLRAAAASGAVLAAALTAEMTEISATGAALALSEEAAAALGGAEARASELQGLLVAAQVEEAATAARVGALPAPLESLQRPDVATIEAELGSASRAIALAAPARALAEREVAEARAAVDRRVELERQRAGAEELVADWTLLAECLGTTGVQALEIDAAGPALTANFNLLLHRAYGPRFTGEVNASRASKDKRQKDKRIDECEILVLDTQAPRPRKADVRTFSGGERAPLLLAFFLGLAMYICNSRGIEEPTIILDEPGGGLGQATVGPWIEMARHASRLVGASKLVVITHDQAVIDAADSVVRVAGGRLTVER